MPLTTALAAPQAVAGRRLGGSSGFSGTEDRWPVCGLRSVVGQVFDADTFSRNDLIGAIQCDMLDVYFREHHEIYRTWGALVDVDNKKDKGIQASGEAGPGAALPSSQDWIRAVRAGRWVGR